MTATKPRAAWRDNPTILLSIFASVVLIFNLVCLYAAERHVLKLTLVTTYALYGGVGVSLTLLATSVLAYLTRRRR